MDQEAALLDSVMLSIVHEILEETKQSVKNNIEVILYLVLSHISIEIATPNPKRTFLLKISSSIQATGVTPIIRCHLFRHENSST